MAVNKNFVVKNGLEVNTNLILADATNDRVGIGTTVPSYTLDVAGGIGATSMYIAGVTTALGNITIGSAGTTLTAIGNSVGVGTDAPAYLLDVRSAVSTGQTALYVYGDMRVSGDINLDDITLDDVRATDLYVTGLSTFVGLTSTGDVRVGAGFSAVGVSSFHNDVSFYGSTGIGNTVLWDASANSLKFKDDVQAEFGSGQELSIYHDGSNGYVKNTTGYLHLQSDSFSVASISGSGENYIVANKDGATELYYDASKRLETTGIGITVQGSVGIRTNLEVAGVSTFSSDVNLIGSSYNSMWDASANAFEFKDEALAIFGTNNDLQISHTNSLASQEDSNGESVVDGWTSYIHENGTGGLVFKSNGNSGEGAYQFFDTSWRPILRLFSGANARPVLYHGGSIRIETTGIGATIGGSLGIRTDLTVAGVATFGSANVVAAGGTFQVGSGGTVFYADTSGTVTISGGSVPSIGLVIALGG